MGSILEIGAAIISQSQRRVEVTAQNVANIATPGFKSHRLQTSAIDFSTIDQPDPSYGKVTTDFTEGKQIDTGNPFDLAVAGTGYFVVRGGEQLFYTREGQFRRDGEGRLVTAGRFVLQAGGGGDLVLRDGDFKVAADGAVTQAGQAVARIGVAEIADRRAMTAVDGGVFGAPDSAVQAIEAPAVRQGMLEASNVSMGDEMVTMMEALRRAEAGQRLVNVYDDLMGRAITAFGQA